MHSAATCPQLELAPLHQQLVQVPLRELLQVRLVEQCADALAALHDGEVLEVGHSSFKASGLQVHVRLRSVEVGLRVAKGMATTSCDTYHCRTYDVCPVDQGHNKMALWECRLWSQGEHLGGSS